MICTSSYDNKFNEKYKTISISGDRGKGAFYFGYVYPSLAPKKTFWKVWHSNIGKISDRENNEYYISEYYKQVLKGLDPEEVYDELDGSILLCYENNNVFCHRQIVAAWFELLLDVEIPEVKSNCGELEFVERDNSIKKELEKVIRNNNDMKNFNSLRGFYLYNKSIKCIKEALLKERNNEDFGDLKTRARDYRLRAMLYEHTYITEVTDERKTNKQRI